jgi:hypothetical protein
MNSSCYVSDLFYYPVKSFKGISLDQAQVDDFGICNDRRFMLVNDDNKFISQRTYPQLSQLNASLDLTSGNAISSLNIFSDTIGNLYFDINEFTHSSNKLSSVLIWNDSIEAYILKNQYTERLSDFLGTNVRLAYMPSSSFRQIDRDFFSEDKRVSFADGYPFLLTSENSLKDLNSKLSQAVPMTNFRPNIVVAGRFSAFSEDNWKRITIGDIVFELVKPCSRCVMTTIDSAGKKSVDKEPLITLSGYRKNKFGICFGQNMVHLSQGKIRKGDVVSFE